MNSPTPNMDDQSRCASREGAGSFAVLDGKTDGHPLFATIDTSWRDYSQKADFPWFLSIDTPLIKPTSDGLTTRDEADELNKWEDALNKGIAAATRFIYIGRVTWKGHRELLYYIVESDSVARTLQSLIDHHTTRPFAFHCEKDDAWSKVEVYFKKSF